MIKRFISHTGVVAPLNVANIDTDVILPKQFLHKITRVGFGKYLFYGWRYYKENDNLLTIANFVLNKKEYKNASILLTGENFGCGSSREHAVWSLIDFGFRAIIAPSFADIFYSNSLKNSLLPIKLASNEINSIFEFIFVNPGISFDISLIDQTVKVADKIYFFKIETFQRYCMLNGLDDISLTQKHEIDIKNYELNQLFFLN